METAAATIVGVSMTAERDREQQTAASKVTRRSVIGAGGAVGAMLTAAPAIVLGAPSPVRQKGTGPKGQNALEFVGRIDQAGEEFVGYAYLNFIHGLKRSLLFSDPEIQTEATARFTMYSTATLTFRSVIGDVHVIDAQGPMDFYFQRDPSADFANPDSFRDGKLIASTTIKIQDILSVIAPNQGIPVLHGDARQTSVYPFSLEGKRYQLGRKGLLTRLSATGKGTRTEETLPTAFLDLAGNTVVTGQR